MPSNGNKTGRDATTGRFAPGNTGGGRKRLPPDIKAMLQDATPDACKLLCDTINDKDAKPELRVKCCEIILNRVYGMPVQGIDLDARNIPQVVFVGADDVRP